MIRATDHVRKGSRVVHVVPALFGEDDETVGGAERYALELARHMANVAPTRLVAFGKRDRRMTIDNLQVRVIGGAWHVRGNRFNPFSMKLLGELARGDVVHCHQRCVVASSVSAIFGMLTRKPVFVSDLGGGGWDVSTYLSTDRWYEGHLHISQYSRELHRQDQFDRAHVIWGGVDELRFSPPEAEDRDGSVVFVGRLLPHKGIDYLVEAMPDDVPLKVIGRPRDPEYLKRLHALASGKRVTFLHDAKDDAIVDAYRRAMCVVLPSVYRTCYGHEGTAPELLGQTLLEGMACGAPAICTRVASMPEVLEDGVSGFVVEPNDPAALRERIVWLREHPEAASEMGRHARARVMERFTWPRVVERCLEIYSR